MRYDRERSSREGLSVRVCTALGDVISMSCDWHTCAVWAVSPNPLSVGVEGKMLLPSRLAAFLAAVIVLFG